MNSAKARELLLEGLLALNAKRGYLTWTPPPAGSLAQAVPGIEIVRLIGRGSMGAVYEARQISLDRRVALKLLPEDLALDDSFLARFRHEGRLIARLQHAHIVTVFDSGETEAGHPFLLMEFIDGESLSERLQRGRPGADEALAILVQVTEAVAAAHEQGVTRRDLKPANILLTRSGQAKVVDFGLAGLAGDGRVAMDPVPGGQVPELPSGGTPGYSAPEQLNGSVNSGPRADVFSLGVLGWELFTGQRPDSLPRPTARPGAIPPRLATLFLCALRRDPARRPPDAREFLSGIFKVQYAGRKAEEREGELRRRRAAACSLARHLDRFSDAVAELYAPPGAAGFPQRIIGALGQLLGSDYACYNEFGPGHFVAAGSPHELTSLHIDGFYAHIGDHPSITFLQSTGSREVVSISDFLSHRQWRDTGLYQEYFHKLGLRHQLGGMFPAGRVQVGFSVNRDRRDFRDDDRALLSRLAGHMPNAWRNADALSRIGPQQNPLPGVTAVTVDSRGTIMDDSPAVREYLMNYFGSPDSRLPDMLRRWLRAQQESRGGEHPAVSCEMVARRPEAILTVRFCAPAAGGGAYLIFEESTESVAGVRPFSGDVTGFQAPDISFETQTWPPLFPPITHWIRAGDIRTLPHRIRSQTIPPEYRKF